jgi:hypothetical protein
VLFILKNLLVRTKDLNSIKIMWNHTKPETLPPIIRRGRCQYILQKPAQDMDYVRCLIFLLYILL